MQLRGKHILYVENLDKYFLSHRLLLASAMRSQGCRVTIMASESAAGTQIREKGFEFVPLPILNKSTNLWRELRTLIFIGRTYMRLWPDIIHQFNAKPVIYGTLVARLLTRARWVNTITGLGYVFTDEDRNVLLRHFIKSLYRFTLFGKRGHTTFQNNDDLRLFCRSAPC